MNVVPELSDRWTTVIVELGRLTPKFMLAMIGSASFLTVTHAT